MVECSIDAYDLTFGGGKEEKLATLCHKQGPLNQCEEGDERGNEGNNEPQKKTQAIRFSSLITKLCLDVGLREITDPAERVPLIVVLSWMTFNRPSRLQSGGASSSIHPQVEERAVEEEQEEEAHGNDECSDEEESDDERPDLHHQIAEITRQMGAMQTKQHQIVAEQRQHMEEFHRHQDRVDDFIRYQVAFNAYMASGQQGDPPTFPLPRPLRLPDHPQCTFMTNKEFSALTFTYFGFA